MLCSLVRSMNLRESQLSVRCSAVQVALPSPPHMLVQALPPPHPHRQRSILTARPSPALVMSTRIPAADYPPKVGEVVGQSDHTFLAEAEAKASSSSSSSSSSEDVSASLLSGEEPTAQIVAFLRYIAPQWRTPGAIVRGKHEEDIGRDLFAHHFLSQRQRKLIGELGVEKLREQLQKGMPGVPQYMWCRTRVIDSELHRLIISADPPIQQLVILGAGYDTRCIRFFAGLHHHKIARFEIDRAEMQAEKRERLEEIVREAELVQSGQPHLSEAVKAISFQSFDLSQPKKELLTTLVHTSFRTNHVTLFIWEGVVMYLTKKDVEETLEFMHNAAAPGSRLLCDFTQKQEDPIQEHIERSLAKKGEPIQFLTDPSEFSDLLSRKGWGVERMFTPDVLRKEYATEDEFEQGGKEWAGANVVLAKRV